MNEAPLFLSIADAAESLGISSWNVKRYLREGKLSARKVGRRTVVEFESLQTLADSFPKATFAPPARRKVGA